MARPVVGRWLAAVCLVTAGTALFGASAGALQTDGTPQLGPLPVELPPVPTTVPLAPRITLPELPPLVDSRPAPTGSTSPPSQPRPLPPESRPAAPATAPASAPTPAPASAQPRSDSVGAGTASGIGPERPQVDLGREAVETARRFSLPLGLSASLIAFLGVQALVDRRDPKLAVAPVDDEVFSFR